MATQENNPKIAAPAVPNECWAKLIKIHNHAKSIFLLAEEFDPESKDFIQPAMELRHGLEHIIRAQAAVLGINADAGDDDDYVAHSFDKAIGHEYRAFFDAADWLSTALRKRIITTLTPYPSECIKDVIPAYYSNIRARIDEISKQIAEIRGAKDVARNSDIDAKVGKSETAILEVAKYREIISELVEIDEKIQSSISSLVDWNTKNRRGVWFTWLRNVGSGIAVALLVLFLKWVFDQAGGVKHDLSSPSVPSSIGAQPATPGTTGAKK